MRALRHSTPKTLFVALIASFLLLTSTNAKELYVGDLNVSNNLVFSNLNIKQSFQCQNLLINTMSATTVKVNSLTMTDIYAEELINSGDQFITLQGSLNIKGSMSWNPEAATTQTVGPTAPATTTETAEQVEPVAAAEAVETSETVETVETPAEPAESAAPVEAVETTETVETPVEPATPPAPETPAAENIPQVSFLKIDSLVLNGVKQWAMIDHENFDNARFSLLQLKNKEINGWRVKNNQASNVESVVVPVKLDAVHSSNQDDKALLTTHSNTIFKEFKKLPKHDSLMVEAQILLQAPAWKGEAVYAKVNDKIIWLEHYDSGEELDNCQLNESSWQRIPLSFNLKHNEESVLIEIGANSPLESFKNCKNLATKEVLGLDDFVMYIK